MKQPCSHDQDDTILDDAKRISQEDYDALLRTYDDIIEYMIEHGHVTDIGQCLEDVDPNIAVADLLAASLNRSKVAYISKGEWLYNSCRIYILNLANKVIPELIHTGDESDYRVMK